jgi:two-component system, OmpR family, phosphate regulon sensor histidine kinase PhoR
VPTRFARRLSPLYLIFPVVLAAAAALGRYAYRYAAQVSQKSEESIVEQNTLLGLQTLDRLDNFIIDSDRQLFDLVDLEHLDEFKRRWSEIVNLSPAIEAAVILDEHKEILPGGYVSKRNIEDAAAFRGLFLKKILPDLPFDTLKADFHKHWHHEYDGRDYLISYIRREQAGQSYFVALKISLEHLVKHDFPEMLQQLRGKVLFCIRDDHGHVVYGLPLGQPGKYLFERAFPTTLYLWRLQMAPIRAVTLTAEERARRRSEFLLITFTLGIVVVGLGYFLYALDKEKLANETKSEFISNVSHELKTPLSLIRMFGELLALGKLKSPEKAKEYAEIITRESERLSRLIDNVLDFSRMERGRAAYDFQPGRLSEVVERALDVYRHRVEREGFRLVTKIDEGLPETLIDENAMTLLLLNLLENAVKYGKGEIAVYLTRVGNDLRLVVGDQGPGIPVDEQRRIFDRFYRTRQARVTNVRGSGIGLSLVKHIAEAHRGRVTVESEPLKGAAFIVDLPIVGAEAAA